MKVFLKVGLAVLVFLAVSSGITKIILMEQDVEFFGRYGFTNPMLIAFGVTQLIGGCLLVPQRTQLVGAGLVEATFLLSAVLLAIEGNIQFAVFTVVALIMLGFVARQNLIDTRHIST